MLTKNNIATGVLIALVFPAGAFATAYLLKGNLYLLNKPALPYLIAIALNLVLMRLCAKKDMVNTVKGIMITTFAFMLAVLLLVVHPIR